MKTVFVDTVYFVALLNPADQLHEAAVRLSGDLEAALVTTEWVLAEVGAAFCRGPHRRLFARLLDILLTSGSTEIVPATTEWFQSGCELFRSRPDKDWSLTDCISFCVMRERAISEAITHDHHFEQAGFQALLRK